MNVIYFKLDEVDFQRTKYFLIFCVSHFKTGLLVELFHLRLHSLRVFSILNFTWFTAATSDVLFDSLRNGLNLSLLTIGSTKLQTSNLKGDEAVGQLYDMNEAVEVIGGQDETVALRNDSPSSEKNVSG
jgi:hypothetical protein